MYFLFYVEAFDLLLLDQLLLEFLDSFEIPSGRYRSQLHRRIYSFYRVTEAAIEAIAVIVVLVLIQIVAPRPNRKINLLNGNCSGSLTKLRLHQM